MDEPKGLFELLEIRASGSYGTVCAARRTGDALERTVGLKVLRGTLVNSPQILMRTRDEARLLSKLKHPNIVGVEELLSINRRPVMVMEWVEGLSLRQILDHHRHGIPAAVALEVTRRTARALYDAYNGTASHDGRPLRIIHRDIKPANLLLSIHGEVKVVDFGVARGEFVERETTTISTILGAHGYMAPERMEGIPDRPAVDVYSLGVSLAELLTGRLPILPRLADGHPVALAHHLDRLKLVGVDDPVLQDIVRSLLEQMCAYDASVRPIAQDVVDLIGTLQSQHALSKDLAAFAQSAVVPLYQARPRTPPHAHPSWDDVAFLEDPNAEAVGSAHETPQPAQRRADQEDATAVADRRVRRFLGQEDWDERKRELKWLLALHPEWSALPFLEVLRRADPPWWQVWARGVTPGQLVVALDVLKHRRTEEVLEEARALRTHRISAVQDAAVTLLGFGDEDTDER